MAVKGLSAWLRPGELLPLFHVRRAATVHSWASPMACKEGKYPRARLHGTGTEPGMRALSQLFQAVILQAVLPSVQALVL